MNTISGPLEAWKRVGQAVRQRRIELGIMTQIELSAEGGPGLATIGNIERGAKPSYEDQVIARLEKRLRWKRGSIEALLAGQEPTEAQTTPDPVTVVPGSRFQGNREYPPLVGTDPFYQWIWDADPAIASDMDKEFAIKGTAMLRDAAGGREGVRRLEQQQRHGDERNTDRRA
jgi:hypothetical protein